MAKFMLVLKGSDWNTLSPEEMQQMMGEYIGWSRTLRERGQYHAGEELEMDGRILRGDSGRIAEGPFTETKEAVGGFYLIEAADYAEALSIAKECPHLKVNGEIEVRGVIPH